jgi:hypothetical protein
VVSFFSLAAWKEPTPVVYLHRILDATNHLVCSVITRTGLASPRLLASSLPTSWQAMPMNLSAHGYLKVGMSVVVTPRILARKLSSARFSELFMPSPRPRRATFWPSHAYLQRIDGRRKHVTSTALDQARARLFRGPRA